MTYNPESYAPHHDWHEFIIDDACAIAALMGWHIEPHDVQFTGFWSQGDGASFTGTLGYRKGCKRAVRDYAPLDSTLHDIAERWQALQARHAYRYRAHIERSPYAGNYSHENTVCISDSYIGEHRYYGPDVPCDTDDTATDIARDFMRWIYRALEREYEFQRAWQHASAWNDAADDAATAREAARAALIDYRASIGHVSPSALATLKAAIRSALTESRDLLELRRQITDNFHYWQDGATVSIEQFTRENV